MTVTETVLSESMPCPFATEEQDWFCANPDLVEVTREGDHEFFECEECGSTWGHRLVESLRLSDCEAGVPEEVRRKAMGERMQPIDLGSVIPVRQT